MTAVSTAPSPSNPSRVSRPSLEIAGLDVFLLDAVTGMRRQILHQIDLTISPGQIVGLTGPSGSGKSTLGLAAAGLLPGASLFSASQWTLLDRNLTPAPGPRTRISARSVMARLGRVPPTSLFFISQDARSSLVPYRSVEWHLRRAAQSAGKTADRAKDIELLDRLGFTNPADFLPRFPRAMSSGECQRIQFAMACRIAPQLLIADEPFASVDPARSSRLTQELKAFTENGRSLLLISHDLPMLASTADRVAVLSNGQIVEQGPSSGVLDPSRPHHPHTADLLRSAGGAPYAALSTTAASGAGPTSDGVLCRAAGISKSFAAVSDHKASSRSSVLKNRSIMLRRGRRVGLQGRSGIGKTTLARILLGLLDADAGQIERFPESPHPWNQNFNQGAGVPQRPGRWLNPLIEALAPAPDASSCERKADLWRRMQLAYQDTDLVFDPAATIGESLAQVIRARRPQLCPSGAWGLADTLLSRFGLPSRLLRSPPRQLSGGERRRAAIARTLAALGYPQSHGGPPDPSDPAAQEDRILILDEPTVGIDVFLQATLAQTLIQAQSELNLSYLVISHDLTFVRRFCNEVIEWDAPS